MTDAQLPRASGVEALIERLREEGIVRGQVEAERIVADAETRARWLLEQATQEADALRNAARRDAERLGQAGRQALDVAFRDAVLRLKAALAGLFHEELRREVGRALGDADLLPRLVLELVGRSRSIVDAADAVTVLLPPRAADLEELKRNPEELAHGALTQLTRRLTRDMLRDGVSLAVGEGVSAGFRLRLQDTIELDFTDETVTELLRAHLHPRFRAMLDGIVR